MPIFSCREAANALIFVPPWKSDPPTTSHVALLPPMGVSSPLKKVEDDWLLGLQLRHWG
jgi:hypothetical protein